MYQKRIKKKNPSFYKAILPYIDSLPDFRPLETVKKMKKVEIDGSLQLEPQNNWRIVCEELEAISCNPLHFSLLRTILDDEMVYIDESDFIEEFVISYSSLVWLLLKISPSRTMYPLCISQNVYLEEIMKDNRWKEYIYAIRSMETAKVLFSSTDKVDEYTISSLLQRIDYEYSKDYLGVAYYCFASTTEIPQYEIYSILLSIAYHHEMNLFKLLRPLLKDKEYEMWFPILIEADFEEAVEFCLKEKKIRERLLDAIQENVVNMVRFFLSKIKNPIDKEKSREILERSLLYPNPTIIKILFEHPFLKKYIGEITHKNIEKIVQKGRTDVIEILINYPLNERIWLFLLNVASEYHREDITKIILERKKLLLGYPPVLHAVEHSNISSVKTLLNHISLHRIEIASLLKECVKRENKEMIEAIMNHPKADISFLPRKLKRFWESD